jgi:hypothetical protein
MTVLETLMAGSVPEKPDDDMEPGQYEHPPWLMPSSGYRYESREHGGWFVIFESHDIKGQRIKSDCYVPIHQ